MPAALELMFDAVKFMQNNVVVVDWDGDAVSRRLADLQFTQGTHLMYLHRQDENKVVGRHRESKKQKLPVYLLKRSSDLSLDDAEVDGTAINVYFCPYRGGRTLGTVIGTEAKLFFTSEMNGCSLGVGSATPNGERLVFHSNAGRDLDTLRDQSNFQHGRLVEAFSTSPLFTRLQDELSPLGYRLSRGNREYCSTSFGVREVMAGWKFYTQRYASKRKGGLLVYTLKGVNRVSF